MSLVRLIVVSIALIGCGRIGFDRAGDGGTDGPPADGTDAALALTAIAIEPPPFATPSATFIDVPGGRLTVPPSPGQTWLLLVSATLQSSSLAEAACEARYLVDNVEAGMGGTQNTKLDRPGPWQHFFVFTGKTTPSEILFQVRDGAGGTASIDQLRAVAVPLPASADPLYASNDAIQAIAIPAFSAFTPVASLTVTPASSGDYVVFLLTNATEAPDASDVVTRWLDPNGSQWSDEMQNPRQPWQSNLVIRRTTLGSGPTTIVMEAMTRATAQVRNIRMLALRTSGLASFDHVASLTQVPTTAMTPAIVNTLATSASSAQSYVAIGTMRLDADCSNAAPAERRVQYGYGAILDAATHVNDNCAYETTYGTVRLLPSRPTSLTAGISSGNGELIHHIESSLVLIGLD